MNDALLDVRELDVRFDGRAAVRRMSFSVADREIVSLFGLNGAGKSVTLSAIAGTVRPAAGTITFEGRRIDCLPPEERAARGIAYVFQGRRLFAEQTVDENLRLGGITVRRSRGHLYESLRASVLDRFPVLAAKSTVPAGTLSSGEQAMLALARALMSAPRLLVVDEPSAGLAPRAVQTLMTTLRALNDDGVTILIAEQNVTHTLRFAHRILLMENGTIVYTARASALDRSQIAERLGLGRVLGAR